LLYYPYTVIVASEFVSVSRSAPILALALGPAMSLDRALSRFLPLYRLVLAVGVEDHCSGRYRRQY
jgi:hypothetical protein